MRVREAGQVAGNPNPDPFGSRRPACVATKMSSSSATS